MNIIDELKWRGLIYQVSDEGKVREYLSTPGRSLYCGFDPTASSLHIGHLVPLLALYRFQRAGHRPIALMGGGTALIGDPSGKDVERQLIARETIEASIESIKTQVRRIFGGEVRFVNNYDWIGRTTAIELLRDVGKYFTVNWMMQKESVKNRISRDEVGISFTEFSYMILQAYDFSVLAEQEGCMLQIGGSDQWGNITAGTELIRKKLGKEAIALTFPLITTADGKKFGKSEKGAIFLDPALTPVYEFYQYFMRTDDRDVIRFLRYFTFVSREEIEALEVTLAERPEQRVPQRRLAAEMTRLVHGEEELLKVEAATAALFGTGDLREVDPAMLRIVFNEAPSVSYPGLEGLPDLPQILVDLGLSKSKGQARKDLEQGGVYVNNCRIDLTWKPSAGDLLHGQALLVRKGKKNYGLVQVG
ncbi:tyrosine--tRNA ligase [Desulfocurvibacter africanus]|uniref:tyrosine--tRNA ligase n=1 Tax=Desulfocurvibacter africanus TaxID=873 RepID=UPI00040298A4|nr:tyrosine--tRNA ligase [Desulfocurvibacter africanus]